MYRVTVLYPRRDDGTFDLDYYRTSHAELIQKLLGPVEGFDGFTIDKGLGGAMPGDPPPFVALGHLNFKTMAALQQGMGAHGQEITADVPNFTNIQPQVVVSQVVD